MKIFWSPTVIKHVDAILKLMSSLTGDSRFEDIINETSKSKKEMITMCEALDRIEKRGEKRGVKLGNFMSIIEIVNNYKNKKGLCDYCQSVLKL